MTGACGCYLIGSHFVGLWARSDAAVMVTMTGSRVCLMFYSDDFVPFCPLLVLGLGGGLMSLEETSALLGGAPSRPIASVVSGRLVVLWLSLPEF